MRKLILSLLLAVAGIISATAENYFDAYRNDEGVEVIQIGKAMLKMANTDNMSMSLGQTPMGPISTFSIIDKLDSIQILNVDDDSNSEKLYKKFNDMFTDKKKGFEVLMLQSDDDESVIITFRKNKKGSNELVVINYDSSELNIIVLSGPFTLEDLNILKNS